MQFFLPYIDQKLEEGIKFASPLDRVFSGLICWFQFSLFENPTYELGGELHRTFRPLLLDDH